MKKQELEILLSHGREIARLRSDVDLLTKRLRSLEVRLERIARVIELAGEER